MVREPREDRGRNLEDKVGELAAREQHVADVVDSIASRMKLYAGTILAVGTVVALTAGGVVRLVTKDVRDEVAQTRVELRQFIDSNERRVTADSIRFERVLEVVELAVVALVEPDGSDEQRGAVAALRSRRTITPRSDRR